MKKLTVEQYKIVKDLFHPKDTNLPAVYGIIEGLIPGNIWADDEISPSSCLLLGEDPYCLIAGQINQNIFSELFNLFKHKRYIKLQVMAKNHKELNLVKFGFTSVPRLEYRYNIIRPFIPYHENTSKFILKAIDNESIFNRCLWKSSMLEIYGQAGRYIKNAIGFALWDKDKQQVVTEAHGIGSSQFIEFATVTHEDYRGKKLSTIICNHLIRYAQNKQLYVVWNCDESNLASRKIAENQGMNELLNYTFYELNNK